MLPNNALFRIISEFIPDFVADFESSYDTRLKTQKLVYLFNEAAGKRLYDFSWYIAGPYSSTLSHQIYDSVLKQTDKYDEWKQLNFSESILLINEKIRGLLYDPLIAKSSLPEYQRYELLASILFIDKRLVISDSSQGDERVSFIKKKLILNKPHFKDVKSLDEIIKLVMRWSRDS